MGDYPKALKAYTQAYTLTSGQNVEAMLGYAEARVLVDESEFEGEAGQLFERAVAMAPDNGKALWYGGVTAYRKQDLATARQRWATLKELGGPPEIMEILNARLAEIDASLGGPSETLDDASPPQVAMAAAVPPAAASNGDRTAVGDGSCAAHRRRTRAGREDSCGSAAVRAGAWGSGGSASGCGPPLECRVAARGEPYRRQCDDPGDVAPTSGRPAVGCAGIADRAARRLERGRLRRGPL